MNTSMRSGTEMKDEPAAFLQQELLRHVLQTIRAYPVVRWKRL
jgi:hypothetical protein